MLDSILSPEIIVALAALFLLTASLVGGLFRTVLLGFFTYRMIRVWLIPAVGAGVLAKIYL
jgi:hypothetical protein